MKELQTLKPVKSKIEIFFLIERKKSQKYNGASWNTVGKNEKIYSKES